MSDATYTLSRDRFLKVGFAGGALLIGFDLGLTGAGARAAVSGSQLNAYIRIGTDGLVTIVAPNSECGQGTSTALPQIVAEELKVDWSQVRMELGDANPAFNNPLWQWQATGGSTSVRGYHDALRTVGAAARELLIAAAASRFNVQPKDCVAAGGVVRGGGKSAGYGELVADAAKLTPPSDPPLTARRDFRLIGQSVPRLDIPAKVNGSAVFGIDVRLPGMLYASVKQAPKVGQTLASYGSAPAGMSVVPLSNAVAVVTSTTTWQAIQAARSLPVTWADGPATAATDSAAMKANALKLLDSGTEPIRVSKNTGDAAAALGGSAKQLQAVYSAPYLPHVAMEPLSATVHVTQSSCEIWAPTQDQGTCVYLAAGITGLPPSAVKVHTTFLGGGFGRKGEADFVEQAIRVANAKKGTPVKLVWSREEDFTHDYYRPSALTRLTGGVDAAGNVTGLLSRTVAPSIMYRLAPATFADPTAVDTNATEGLDTLLYAIPSQRTEWILEKSAVRVSWWRSVGNSYNVFFAESFVDELALLAGRDPIDFRRGMLAGNPRALAVLNALADKSGWATPPPAGRARGVAIAECFGTIVGQVAEVSGSIASGIRVRKVTVVVDCGSTINPGIVKAQMESAVIQGMGVALWSDMPFVAGQPMRRNFNQFRMARSKDTPQIDTTIIESGAALGGVGEPGLPATAPAIGNAIFRLTGRRLRSLPFFPQSTGGGG